MPRSQRAPTAPRSRSVRAAALALRPGGAGAAPVSAATSVSAGPAAVLDVAAGVAAQVGGLSPVRLLEGERAALSGSLFLGGPALVHAAAQALDSGRFPGRDGAALRDAQARASAWGHLCGTLEALLALARDEHVRHQSGAIAEAQKIVACLRHEAAAPDGGAALRAPGAPLPRRALCLQPALAILKEHQINKRRAARERQRLELTGAPPAPRRRGRPPAGASTELQRDLAALLQRRAAPRPPR